MTYGILTLDDTLGLVLPVSILAFLVCLIFQSVLLVLRIFLPISATSPKRTEKKDGSNSNDSQNGSLNFKSLVFLFVLCYLLQPLGTMLHLRGQRQNMEFSSRSQKRSGLHDLVYGKDPLMKTLLDKIPSLRRGPKPPFLWSNRHLQFFPWLLQNEMHRQEGMPFQRMDLEVTACLDKSTPECIRDPLMNDTITLDVFPPFDDVQNQYPGFHAGSPIIFFSPGLRCHSHDLPGTMIIRRAFAKGIRSVVVNRRGHTPDRKLRAPRFNLFGDVHDLEQSYWHIHEHYAAPHTPSFLHGISSGTAVVVSALAEFDKRRWLAAVVEASSTNNNNETTTAKATFDNGWDTLYGQQQQQHRGVAPSFIASVSVVPGYDISKVMMPERFKYPYNPLLTESVKDHFVRTNEDVLRAYDSEAVDLALEADNLQDFVNAVAPFAGYPNATEYYKGENPINDMQYITTPKLVLNSIDDPCVSLWCQQLLW